MQRKRERHMKKKYYVVVPGNGDPCPRCRQPTEIREHDIVLMSISMRTALLYTSGRTKHWIKIKNPKAPAVKREAEEDWVK